MIFSHFTYQIMKYTLILAACCFFITGCLRSRSYFKRKSQTTTRSYEVILYSGGQPVFQDKFRGVVNDLPGGGTFYYKGDTLVEVFGDYIIKSER